MWQQKFNRTFVVLLFNCFIFILEAMLTTGCESPKPATSFDYTESIGQSAIESTPTIFPAGTSTKTNSFTGYSTWINSQETSIPYIPISNPPKLWTKIKKESLTIFPYSYVVDYTYDKNGSLWMVGGFGVIRKDIDQQQVWYSMKNGLPTNMYTRIAISPSGDIWIGGANNAILRFDGTQWINEGESLPLPFDGRTHYLCYSKTISGIDFDTDGSVWVMNGGIEIYHRIHDHQWVNVYFPKEILPVAGGGACPIGFRVQSANNITIKISPC